MPIFVLHMRLNCAITKQNLVVQARGPLHPPLFFFFSKGSFNMGVLHYFSQHLPLLHCQLCKQPTQQKRMCWVP